MLEQGQVGKDKNGNQIYNRTWVEKTLSWEESKAQNEDTTINIQERSSKKHGYVYILRNPAHIENLFKIGLTTNTAEERAKQLSGTPSPDKFLVVNRWETSDCLLAEKLVHNALDIYRINPKREFFKVSLDLAVKTIARIIIDVNSRT